MIYMDNRSSHFLGIANDQIYDKRHENYCISICSKMSVDGVMFQLNNQILVIPFFNQDD